MFYDIYWTLDRSFLLVTGGNWLKRAAYISSCDYKFMIFVWTKVRKKYTIKWHVFQCNKPEYINKFKKKSLFIYTWNTHENISQKH